MRYLFLLILVCPLFLNAQFTVAPYFSDNMVLQRDEPIHVWGKAIPKSRIKVSFLNQTKYTIAQSDSGWDVYMTAEKANSKSNELVIESSSCKSVFKNVLVGDIWLCIGQSNMLFTMREEMHYKEEFKNAQQSILRFYNPTYIGKDVYNAPFTDSMLQRLNYANFYSQVNWNISDSQSFRNMSAVGYYFGKELVKDINIPIGLINLSIGGAPIETFINETVYKKDSMVANKLNGNWLYNNALPKWIRIRSLQNVGNVQNVPSNMYGPNHAFKPGFAYESGIKPLTKLSIKGIIWYQGESNSLEINDVEQYAYLQKIMIEDYRKQWNKRKLPFYWVQLSSIDTITYQSKFWPQFREEQRRAMENNKYTGMAVSSDIGLRNNVHPTNKKLVGYRLAQWALNKVYFKKVVPSGPLPLSAKYKNGKVLISFKYANEGLFTSDNKSVTGFSLDGISDCDAIIEKNNIVLNTETKPGYVYYSWKPYAIANLINKANLPTSTFKIKVK